MLRTNQSSQSNFKCSPVETLENQLHEQYAINNNSNATSLIAILSALTIGFVAYGYVVCEYYPHVCKEQTLMMLLASILVIELLVLLYVLSIYFGTAQRLEQFVTFSIRAKRYGEKVNSPSSAGCNSNGYYDIYPKNYHPYSKNFCEFVQGIYDVLSKVMVIALLFIVITTLCLCPPLRNSVLFHSCWLVSLCYMLYYRFHKYQSYKKREKDYIYQLSKSTDPVITEVLKKSTDGCPLISFIKKCCRNWEKIFFPFMIMIFSVVMFVILINKPSVSVIPTVSSVLVFFCSIYAMLIINDKYNFDNENN